MATNGNTESLRWLRAIKAIQKAELCADLDSGGRRLLCALLGEADDAPNPDAGIAYMTIASSTLATRCLHANRGSVYRWRGDERFRRYVSVIDSHDRSESAQYRFTEAFLAGYATWEANETEKREERRRKRDASSHSTTPDVSRGTTPRVVPESTACRTTEHTCRTTRTSYPSTPGSPVRTPSGTPLLYLSTSIFQSARAREEQESCQSDDDEIEDEETTREPDPQPEEELVMSYEPIPKPVLDTPNASLPSGPMGQCVRKHLEINPGFRYRADWCAQFRDLLSQYLELGGTVHEVMAMMDTCAEEERLRSGTSPTWMNAYRVGLKSMISEKRRAIVEPAAREAQRRPKVVWQPVPDVGFVDDTDDEMKAVMAQLDGE